MSLSELEPGIKLLYPSARASPERFAAPRVPGDVTPRRTSGTSTPCASSAPRCRRPDLRGPSRTRAGRARRAALPTPLAGDDGRRGVPSGHRLPPG